jgi:hypothetical protein
MIPLDPAIVSGGYLLRRYGGSQSPQPPEAKKRFVNNIGLFSILDGVLII